MLDEPLEKRQKALREMLNSPPARVRLSEVFDVKPERLLAAARKHHWEGIIAKRSGSRYESARRSGAWLKCKVRFEQEFVIGGYTIPRGGRSHFGALLVGHYRDGTLEYAGKVGTGFSEADLSALHRHLVRERRIRCPFQTPLVERGASWVRPVLVGQVSFTEWTRDGLLRQASFLGLRDDKPAQHVRLEESVAPS